MNVRTVSRRLVAVIASVAVTAALGLTVAAPAQAAEACGGTVADWRSLYLVAVYTGTLADRGGGPSMPISVTFGGPYVTTVPSPDIFTTVTEWSFSTYDGPRFNWNLSPHDIIDGTTDTYNMTGPRCAAGDSRVTSATLSLTTSKKRRFLGTVIRTLL